VTASRRTVAGYLTLPRPRDAVKWAIVPMGFVIGASTTGDLSAGSVGRGLLVWAVLELLVYQARYQVNDMIGFDADQRHPDGDRGRLPGPVEKKRSRIASSAAAALFKIGLTGVIAVLAPAGTGRTLALVTLAVAATAVVYEPLRALATGRTGQVPAPASPGVVAIWVVIGAGYAIRGVTGLSLAVPSGRSWLLLSATAVAWWAFGVGWVTSRWAVEATAYGRMKDGRLTWTASADEAREHLLALVRWLPACPDPGDVSPEGNIGGWRATSGFTPLLAPWHEAAIVSGGFAALTGWLLVDPSLTVAPAVVAVVAGMAGTTMVAAWWAHRPLAACAGVVLLAGLAFALGVRHAPLSVLPWAVATAAQVSYLRQCRNSLGAALDLVQAALRPAGRDEARWMSTT
jgi:hypothetical protein